MVIAIFGLGLIGGSLGRAILKKTEYTVLGCDSSEGAVLKAKLLNAVTDVVNDENIKTADMIALALCPTAAIETMEKIAPKLKKGAMIFDCCGVKRQIVAKMRELSKAYPDLGFLGVHPMAGREFSGISHSTPSLYERAYIIFTPVAAPIEKIAEVKKLFLDIGAEGVQIASADFHDRIIAYTSQLAHVVSSSYIRNPLSREHVGFSAGSFKDMTRVAKLNPDMWTELFLHNADYLTAAIEELQKSLSDLKSAISKKDADKLHKLLSEGAEMKEYAEKQRKNEEALKDLDKEPY